jgi:hypothetical protein
MEVRVRPEVLAHEPGGPFMLAEGAAVLAEGHLVPIDPDASLVEGAMLPLAFVVTRVTTRQGDGV